MQSLWINKDYLEEIASKMLDGHIGYKMYSAKRGDAPGTGKAPFTENISHIKYLDCSGFVRYFIYKVTEGRVKMPDGSYIQHAWCTKNHFKSVPAKDAGKVDNILRIGFLAPKNGHAGHVWLVLNGWTIESHGGVGPSSRPWNTHVLRYEECFEFAHTFTGSTVLV